MRRIILFDVACAKEAGAAFNFAKKFDAKTWWWAENIDGLNINSKTQQKKLKDVATFR